MRPSLASDASGAAGIVFGLMLVVLVSAAGAAIDYGRAASQRTSLQSVTDQAALAGLTREAASLAEREALAEAVVRSRIPALTGEAYDAAADGLRVEASVAVPTVMMRILGFDAVPVSAVSQAIIREGLPCILILETSANGMELNSNSSLRAECGVHVNSSNAEAIFANSRSQMAATRVCAVGGVRLNGGSAIVPEARTGCLPKADPLASLPEPYEASRPCDVTGLVVNAAESVVLKPGVYCDTLEINSGSSVRLEPGVYVIRDGELKVNSQSSLSGAEVMLFFQGEKGRLNVNSDSRVSLSAPRSGAYAGVLMFQSRAAETRLSDYHILNSDASTLLEGVLYFPNGQLMLNSRSEANASAAWTALIARRLALNSAGTFVARAGYASATPVPAALAGLGRERDVVLVQ